MTVLEVFKRIGPTEVMDIFFMSALIYALLVWFKRSKAAFVLIGIFIIGVVYLLSRQFNLILTAAVFQGFFAVILIAVIVIFQEEIKHLFERVAVWSLNRGPRKKLKDFSRNEVEILARSLTDFARDRIGALIVLKAKDIIVRHLEAGVDLNGELSEPILKSLFDPHSDGHDGAVIIDGNQVTQFAVHLPLSKDLKKVGRTGTRHAAALGLAELTDALCIVVSEELGTISVAQNGEIEIINDAEKLKSLLEKFYADVFPLHQNTWRDLITKNFREKVLAVFITLVLWTVFIYGKK
jgi:diadenylate cyclase